MSLIRSGSAPFAVLLAVVAAGWAGLAVLCWLSPTFAVRGLLTALAGLVLLAGFAWYCAARWARGPAGPESWRRPAVLLGFAWLLCLGSALASTLAPRGAGGSGSPDPGRQADGAPEGATPPAEQFPPVEAAAARMKLDPGGVPVPVPFGAETVFPTFPSPFVAVGKSNFTAWDLQTRAVAGQFLSEQNLGGPLVLSRDGRHLACVVSGEVHVLSLDSRAAPTRLPEANVDWMDFAGPGRLVTLRKEGKDRVAKVWDLARGRAVLSLPGLPDCPPGCVALSPDGRFLALGGNPVVTVQELRAGTRPALLGLPAPRGAFGLGCMSLAFAPDGAELAGLFGEAFAGWRVVTWDPRQGRLLVDHKLQENLGGQVRGAFFYRGPPLQWLPDKSGWLLYSQVLLDRKTGLPVGKAIRPESDLAPPRCQVLTPRFAARQSPLPGLAGAQIQIIALPKR
jgi:hypothetical protein